MAQTCINKLSDFPLLTGCSITQFLIPILNYESGHYENYNIDFSELNCLLGGDNYITGGTYSDGYLYFSGVGTNFSVDVSGLLDDTNTYTTGSTLSGNTLILSRNDGVDLYTDFSTLIPTGSTYIPLSNTVWVNDDLTTDNPNERIFKSYQNAVDWINANGNLSSSNRWVISFNYLNTVTLYDNIIVDCDKIQTLINGRNDTLNTAHYDRITYVTQYNLNNKNCYFYYGKITNFTGDGSFFGFNTNIGTVSTNASGNISLYNSRIGFVNSIHNRTTTLLSCQIGGEVNISAGFVDLYQCQVITSNTQYINITNGTLRARLCQGNISQSGGTINTYNHEGTIIRNGGTWNNYGSVLNAESFNGNLTTGCTDTQLLANAVDQLVLGNCGLILTTYENLTELINNNELRAGCSYLITDYQTVHYILDGNGSTNITNTGTTEPLIVKATSENIIDKEAYSPLYPKDVIYYSVDTDQLDVAFYNGGNIIPGFKGVIYYRHDTIQNVETWYDFRNVKFRRWAVSATDWVSETSYEIKHVVRYNNKIYKCKKTHTGITNNPSIDTTNWVVWLHLTSTDYWSWVSDKEEFNVGDIDTTNLIIDDANYIDVYTFGDWYPLVKDVSIGRIDLAYVRLTNLLNSILNNIVFFTKNYVNTCRENVIKNNGFNNSIDAYFKRNIIGDSFNSNTIGESFEVNTIGDYFRHNNVGNYFRYNNVGNDFRFNNIGRSFTTNNIGYSFRYNDIGDTFVNNNTDNYFQYNIVGDYFRGNNVGNSFYSNTIGNYFGIESVTQHSYGNVIGNYCYGNIIGATVTFNYSNLTGGTFTVGETVGYGSATAIILTDNGFDLMTVHPLNFILTPGDTLTSNGVTATLNFVNATFNDTSFYGNYIQNFFNSNSITDGFKLNNITNNVNNIDFMLATHVYGDYDCEIYKDKTDGLKLSYIDLGVVVIKDVTE